MTIGSWTINELDNSHQSPTETVDAILTRGWTEARLPEPPTFTNAAT